MKKPAKKILKTLRRKDKLIEFNGGLHYGIIAKSIEGKEKLKEEGFHFFDLEDILKP
jgi:hypothetical protein